MCVTSLARGETGDSSITWTLDNSWNKIKSQGEKEHVQKKRSNLPLDLHRPNKMYLKVTQVIRSGHVWCAAKHRKLVWKRTKIPYGTWPANNRHMLLAQMKMNAIYVKTVKVTTTEHLDLKKMMSIISRVARWLSPKYRTQVMPVSLAQTIELFTQI